jgi:hypothetical protein
MPGRIVHCEDAIAWLHTQSVLPGSVITSLPDVSGTTMLFADWRAWFIATVALTISKCAESSVAIFYQTDVKLAGAWVDKAFLCQRGAEEAGAALLWHKIVCRKPAGTITFGRPAYSHMLCFSRALRPSLARSTADVIDSGEMTWSQAMGVNACRVACEFVRTQTSDHTIVDPFCGKGTVLAAANALGLDAVGVEIVRRRAKNAKRLQL